LLLLWSLELQILSFAIRRVGVDEIEKEKLGEVKEYHAMIAKGVGGERSSNKNR
jgi:hypothetical protein